LTDLSAFPVALFFLIFSPAVNVFWFCSDVSVQVLATPSWTAMLPISLPDSVHTPVTALSAPLTLFAFFAGLLPVGRDT